MSIKIRNTKEYLTKYSLKLMDLLRKELDTPQPGRENYANPRITNTGAGKESIQPVYRKDTMTELGIDIVGNEYLKNIEEGTLPKKVDVEDLIEWIKSKPVNYRRANATLTLSQLSQASQNRLARNMANNIRKRILEQGGVRQNPFITRTVESHLKNLKVIAPVVEDVKESVEDILREAGFDLKGKTVRFV